MAPTPSLKLTFSSPYRGGQHSWSCKFHFAGGYPTTSGERIAFYHAVRDGLKVGLLDTTNITGGWLYPDDTSPSDWYSGVDTTGGSIAPHTSGDQALYVAALLRWTTTQRNSRGGPIYLRNFIHGVKQDTADFDMVIAAQQSALDGFAHDFSAAGAGFSDGTHTLNRAGPNGAVGQAGTCNTYVSHRVLARRG